MDFLNTSPQATPLLVKLYEGHKIYALAADKSAASRAELTNIVAQILDLKLTFKEEELLSDILISLMKQAELDLRKALSERMSTMTHLPLRLALSIANDEIDVAAAMLRLSPVLTDMDLIYIIKSQGRAYWHAIAERAELSCDLADALVDTNDDVTAIKLASHKRADLSAHAVKVLVNMAKTHTDIATPLLARGELPIAFVQELYAVVSAEIQSQIRIMYGSAVANDLAEVFSNLFNELSDQPHQSEYYPTQTMLQAAEYYAQTGMLTLQLVMDTLKRGQINSFIALFARYSDISASRVHQMLMQSCPKGIVIACRAFGVQKSDFTNIFLLTHRMRNEGRMLDYADLAKALSYFDTVRPDTALRVLKSNAAKG
jgi:uncharacterized protein (DUF2336 family)